MQKNRIISKILDSKTKESILFAFRAVVSIIIEQPTQNGWKILNICPDSTQNVEWVYLREDLCKQKNCLVFSSTNSNSCCTRCTHITFPRQKGGKDNLNWILIASKQTNNAHYSGCVTSLWTLYGANQRNRWHLLIKLLAWLFATWNAAKKAKFN